MCCQCCECVRVRQPIRCTHTHTKNEKKATSRNGNSVVDKSNEQTVKTSTTTTIITTAVYRAEMCFNAKNNKTQNAKPRKNLFVSARIGWIVLKM